MGDETDMLIEQAEETPFFKDIVDVLKAFG